MPVAYVVKVERVLVDFWAALEEAPANRKQI